MKKPYRSPTAKKVDYAFQEQVAASSYPLNNYADPWHSDYCTWSGGDCSIIFNVATNARGLDDCLNQGFLGS